MNIYDIAIQNRDNTIVTMDNYKDKVLLIVNTATRCGFTKQYDGLQALYDTYQQEGLEILDFPCNQFAGQAPEENEEIHAFCTLNFGTKFPQFGKIDVNGANESPLYTYLKQEQKGVLGDSIKWNFTKFLVDRQGNVVARYAPKDEPRKLEEKIKNLLEK